jgi:hypothetical protein
MSLRPPPSLQTPSVRSFPPGRLFRIISEGYGMMPPYRAELPNEARWGVVAYLRALELSQNAPLALAPSDVRARLMSEVP